ncbi:MAG: OmpH/Skp family outer membrane protein [Phycisphaerales bacterium]
MTRNAWIVMTAAVVVAVTLTMGLRLQGQNAAAGATRAAVVDVDKVFNDLSERSKIEADINTRISDLQKWLQDQNKDIEAIKVDLGILKPDTAEYNKKLDTLTKMAISAKVESDFRQRQIEQEKAIQLENLYRKMIDAVERVAKNDGYDLVLFKDNIPPSLRGANQQQIAQILQVRKCLYAAPQMDLTDRVKTMLNNDYTNRK